MKKICILIMLMMPLALLAGLDNPYVLPDDYTIFLEQAAPTNVFFKSDDSYALGNKNLSGVQDLTVDGDATVTSNLTVDGNITFDSTTFTNVTDITSLLTAPYARRDETNTFTAVQTLNTNLVVSGWIRMPMNIGLEWYANASNYVQTFATSSTQLVHRFTVDNVSSNVYINLIGE